MIVQCREEIGKWILSPRFIYLLFMLMCMFIMFVDYYTYVYVCLWVTHTIFRNPPGCLVRLVSSEKNDSSACSGRHAGSAALVKY